MASPKETARIEPPIDPSRRKFLKFLTYSSGTVMVVGLIGGGRDLIDAVSYSFAEQNKFLPSRDQVVQAEKTVDVYKKTSEQLAREGRINQLSQSLDANAVQNAYRTIEIDKSPNKFFPEEFKRIDERNKNLNQRAAFLIGSALVSEVVCFLSWAVGVRVDAQKIKPEENPPFPVTLFIKKMPSGTVKNV